MFSDMPRGEKKLIYSVLLIACATFGAFGAFAITRHDDAQASEPLLIRTEDGYVQTGEVSTITVDGKVKRVIHWRTRQGKLITETVTGPTSYRTAAGARVFVPGPTATVVNTMTLPGHTNTVNQVVTVTGPGATVTLPPDTVTVHDTVTDVRTVTDIQTVTETQTQTVTETVTETVPLPQ